MFAGLVVAVSLAALTLALCRALATLFAFPEGFWAPSVSAPDALHVASGSSDRPHVARRISL